MPNMVSRARGNLIVCAHNTETPTNAEWEEFLELLRHGRDIAELRVLVFTDGAAPDTMQRAAFTKLCDKKQPRIAVLSGSRMVRGVATAISWFNPNIDVFPPDNVNAALEHLRIAASEWSAATDIAGELRRQLSR
jgi:hypothetical protein